MNSEKAVENIDESIELHRPYVDDVHTKTEPEKALTKTLKKHSGRNSRSAVLNSGVEFPAKRITVNLSPAGSRKELGFSVIQTFIPGC